MHQVCSVLVEVPSQVCSSKMSINKDKKLLEEKLICALCNDKFKEPKVLTCLHSFCKCCLSKLVTTVKQGQKPGIVCPTCRKWTEVQRKEARSLPDNFFATNLLSVLAVHSSTNGNGIVCDACDTGESAVSRCGDCSMFLCDFCTQSHKRQRLTNQHQLTSMDDVRASRPGSITVFKPITCKEHDDEALKLFCEVCELAICRDCAFMNHRDHTVEMITDALLKQKPNILKLLMKTEACVPRLEGGIRAVGQMKKKITNNAGDQEVRITNLVDQLIEALEKRREELVLEIHKMKQQKLKVLETQEAELQVAVANVRSSAEFTRQALDSENAAAIMSLKQCITKRLEELSAKAVSDKPKESASYGFSEKGVAELHGLIKEVGHVGYTK